MSESTSVSERLVGALDRLFEPNRATLPEAQLGRILGALTLLREDCKSAEGKEGKEREILSATFRLWRDLRSHASSFHGDEDRKSVV